MIVPLKQEAAAVFTKKSDKDLDCILDDSAGVICVATDMTYLFEGIEVSVVTYSTWLKALPVSMLTILAVLPNPTTATSSLGGQRPKVPSVQVANSPATLKVMTALRIPFGVCRLLSGLMTDQSIQV